MVQIDIERAYLTHGTYGELTLPNGSVLSTVERPWVDNAKNISCIPEGTYICRRVDSPKFGNSFEVTNVTNRTEILFHVANIPSDVEGCIGLCLGRPILFRGEWGYSQSADGMDMFRQALKTTSKFTLVIKTKEGG